MSSQPHTTDEPTDPRTIEILAAYEPEPMPADVLDRIRQRLAVEHASRYPAVTR